MALPVRSVQRLVSSWSLLTKSRPRRLIDVTDRNRKLYTAPEAAQLLGVGRSTVYELIARGDVPATRVGRRVFLTASTLEALLDERPPPPCDIAV
jgi:excisionase family DNA binding protein